MTRIRCAVSQLLPKLLAFLVVTTIVLTTASSASAQIVAATSRGIVVAHDGSIDLFDKDGRELLWKSEGVKTPHVIVVSNERIAVLDAIENQVRIISLGTGSGMTVPTGETPIGGAFVSNHLYVLERDAGTIDRIGFDGARTSIDVGADPAFLQEANGTLYIYGRGEGTMHEISTAPFALTRTAIVARFASAMKVDAGHAYLVFPRDGKVGVVSLASMKSAGSVEVGAVPVDVAFASAGTALSARTLAIADPSAKKVWLVKGTESFGQAFARGFLRGLIGLGLFDNRSSQFPTGIDRLIVAGSKWYAFDSSSGTLYRFTAQRSSVVVKNVAAKRFVITPAGIFVWDEAVRRLQKRGTDE